MESTRRYERCKCCSKIWNVSISRKKYRKGYLCPKCRAKKRHNFFENVVGFGVASYFLVGIPIIVALVEKF